MTWYENQGEVNNKENAVQNLVFPKIEVSTKIE
jgi:hypothetical protein